MASSKPENIAVIVGGTGMMVPNDENPLPVASGVEKWTVEATGQHYRGIPEWLISPADVQIIGRKSSIDRLLAAICASLSLAEARHNENMMAVTDNFLHEMERLASRADRLEKLVTVFRRFGCEGSQYTHIDNLTRMEARAQEAERKLEEKE